MAIAGTIVEFPARQVRRRGHEIAFLPAALEMMETPPSPIGRAIGATIIAFFCLALAWAMVGKVDIVAAAPGRIVPDDRVKVIQPFESGVVHAIHVREGASVRAGDVLIELDPTISAAETDHIKSDFVAAELEVARIKAALAGNADPLNDFVAPADASQALVETDRRFLVTQTAEQDAKLAEITRQLAEKQAESETITATIAKLQATLPPLQERVAVSKNLYDKGLASKMSYLTDLQDLVGQQHDLPVLESRQHEVEAAIAVLEETRSRAKAEYRRTLFDDLAKTEQKEAGLSQDLIKAQQKAKMQTLTAPVDGVVQQLSVHTIGGVVAPAQTLAIVVPADASLEIEAMVSNDDIGFVSQGQDAEIKVDTFNFTRYGLLHGRVLGISRDAVANDRRENAMRDPSSGSENSASQNGTLEPAYLARISLDRRRMRIEGRTVDLAPGMSVMVEIKTGSRTIISYLLSPLIRYEHDVLRER
ncbi:HlyD family type I secretion periplasmic adaptor subunit [Mesorhizobium sp. VK9D]|uniref:HlyD family type I secretion periplasmic adaptor subunit n=1 Tax=Mesorhizobium australafricanum TaxID=3072311 RepID=UPI002A23B96B|nr:HlyD family type I secretion periplasmic adaptor subunit [Mesorhizobium sp. VK9D]MDX8456328.1 HlyD family type I secretion periplasmic adaptor subunit [Mesorhizobium sp. VK9D]